MPDDAVAEIFEKPGAERKKGRFVLDEEDELRRCRDARSRLRAWRPPPAPVLRKVQRDNGSTPDDAGDFHVPARLLHRP
jgi:hypothetical protein